MLVKVNAVGQRSQHARRGVFTATTLSIEVPGCNEPSTQAQQQSCSVWSSQSGSQHGIMWVPLSGKLENAVRAHPKAAENAARGAAACHAAARAAALPQPPGPCHDTHAQTSQCCIQHCTLTYRCSSKRAAHQPQCCTPCHATGRRRAAAATPPKRCCRPPTAGQPHSNPPTATVAGEPARFAAATKTDLGARTGHQQR